MHYAATFITTAATPAMKGSGDIVFFHEDATSTLYEFVNSTSEFMSRGVRPRGPSGE
jgi:hypothetical protein